MLEEIKYINDKEISSILNDNHVVQHRTKEERKKLVEFYKANRSELVYKLITNFNLLYKRNNEEHIGLIKKAIFIFEEIRNSINEKIQITEDFVGVEDFTQFYKFNIYKNEENYSKYIQKRITELFEIVSNFDILDQRTYEEQLMLIEKYKNVYDIKIEQTNLSPVQDFTYDIIVNKNILKNFDNKEQIEFIDFYSKESNIKNKMNEILNNKILFEKRKFSEINSMIWLLLENKGDEKIYKLITDENILLNRTFEEQIELIYNYLEKFKNENCFELFIDKDILEARNYKEQLQLIKIYLYLKTSDIYELIISKSLLKNRNYFEQIDLILKYSKIAPNEMIFNMLLDTNLCKVMTFQDQSNLINECILYNEKKEELENMKILLNKFQDQIKDKNAEIEILKLEITKCKIK